MSTGEEVNTGEPSYTGSGNLNRRKQDGWSSEELKTDLPQDPAKLLVIYLRGVKLAYHKHI